MGVVARDNDIIGKVSERTLEFPLRDTLEEC